MRAAQGTQTLIRNLLKAHKKPLRQTEIRDLIGLSGANGYGRVNNAIRDLVRNGEIEKTGYGRYQWVKDVPVDAYCKKQSIMWRFMWIRSKKSDPFTVRDIFEMTGVAMYTARTYVTFLSKNGFLHKSGRKRTLTTRAPLYLIDREKMQIEAPGMLRRRESAEIEDTLDQVRELATQFYYTADTRPETINSLVAVSAEINGLLSNCIQLRKE
ncbi:FaeA/PapI family transcriptional regulator [uncultured Desulfosarcina sp.]|uniref:FaeA/PapI family transcriptional regulator n=1 Tax=uncultured Desulfosarcina sp. TaxID=218289 RepID=UPI0029C85E25|nr:FaeA/PapI family transcriptional regulator [uncultured Desulfosarcina sp.]